MSLICFDNHVLIWGIREIATQGQENMIPVAKTFINTIDSSTTKVMIPTVVVSEFLMPIQPNMHSMIMNLLNISFIIIPFDMAAASCFSKIWQSKKQDIDIEQLAKNGKTRAELKVDSMIVATAVSRSADCIYSHDAGVKAFAQGYIDVKDIPFIATTPDAFQDKQENTDWGKLPDPKKWPRLPDKQE